MPEERVGKVEHYYPKAKAAAVGLEKDLHVGDEIHIVGHGDDVRKKVTSLQLNRIPVQDARAGEHVGVGLATKVHEGDEVMLVEGDSGTPPANPHPAPRSRKAPRKAVRRGARKPAKAAKAKKGKAAKRRKPAGKKAKPKSKARKAPRREKSARKATRKRR